MSINIVFITSIVLIEVLIIVLLYRLLSKLIAVFTGAALCRLTGLLQLPYFLMILSVSRSYINVSLPTGVRPSCPVLEAV